MQVPGQSDDDQIMLQTVVDSIRRLTSEQVIAWKDGGEEHAEHFPSVSPLAKGYQNFRGENSSVISGVQQSRDGKREVGIVYDATAYGSGSPTAHFALLRLEGAAWKLIWDVEQAPNWRGSHGRIEFPSGDLSQLVVYSDSWSEGADDLSGVIFEANSGPHRSFVDTWVRQGDGYMRESAKTLASAYATLVEFLYALGTGDDVGAGALVTDASLVEKARAAGLDGWAGKNWLIACPIGDCGVQAGPIGFDPQHYHGEPNALVSFVERNGQWLISSIDSQ